MGDDCECGAPREIMVTGIEHDTLFVTKKANHRPDWHDGLGGPFEETDVMAWEFNGRTATFGWVEYPVLGGYGNGVPCLRCWKLVDMPISLFLKDGRKGQLTFCLSCVENNRMLRGFVQGGTYANFKAPRSK